MTTSYKASLPTLRRRNELARFYAALATELAAWREANVDREPTGDNAPLVWKIHESFLNHEYGRAEPPDDWATTAARVNREVLAQAPAVVGDFELSPAEASRLYALMCEHENAPLAPYEPSAVSAKW